MKLKNALDKYNVWSNSILIILRLGGLDMPDTFRRIVCAIYSSYPRLPDKYFQHSAYFSVDRGT